jgi:hypothetical protein
MYTLMDRISFENINYNVCICFHGFTYELAGCLNPVANAVPPLSGLGGASLANKGSRSSALQTRDCTSSRAANQN